MDWLTSNGAAVQAICTAVLVLVTGYYAWKTRGLAKATHTMATATQKLAEGADVQSAAMRELADSNKQQHRVMIAESYKKPLETIHNYAAKLRKSAMAGGDHLEANLDWFVQKVGGEANTLPEPLSSVCHQATTSARDLVQALRDGQIDLAEACMSSREICSPVESMVSAVRGSRDGGVV